MRTIFIILFLSFTSIVYSQKKEVLDGIFDIRLGMSKEEIMQVADPKMISENSHKSSFNLEEYIQNMKYQKVREYSSIVINEYTPLEGFTIEMIELYFFEDMLFSIKIREYTRLENALSAKYGSPKEKEKKKTDIEYKTYAERTSEDDYIKSKTTYISEIKKTWKTNDKNIECRSITTYDGEYSKGDYCLEIKNKSREKKLENFAKVFDSRSKQDAKKRKTKNDYYEDSKVIENL